MVTVYVVDGRLLYSESRGGCFDEAGHVVRGDCAMSLGNLKEFLDLSDDTEIVVDPMADTHVLFSKCKKAEINSMVIFEAWQKGRTPAITLLKRGKNGKFIYDSLFQFVDEVPQRFWEVMYPDARSRAIAKTRSRFFLHNVPLWYFIGGKTETLYMVYRESVVAPYYCAVYDSEDHGKTRELGILDGLNQDGFREAGDGSEFNDFTFESLVGTDYQQRKLETPEDILFMGRCNSDIKTILGEILTVEEIERTREVESIRMQLWNEYLV